MALEPRPHPPALAHGALEEVLPGIYFVQGTNKMPGFRFSRNMVAIKQGERLVLVNSVRLDDAGLAALDKLGKVTDVIRLAANHGMDDPFYAEHYGAKVWTVKGQRYSPGLDVGPDTYFEPDHEMTIGSELPIEGAKLVVLEGTPPEGLLLVGETLISGDCLQNWAKPDRYFSGFAKLMMRVMGFIKPHNIGPAWHKKSKPPKEQLGALRELPFVNVLPAHGTPVIGDARDLYKPALDRVSA